MVPGSYEMMPHQRTHSPFVYGRKVGHVKEEINKAGGDCLPRTSIAEILILDFVTCGGVRE